MYTVHEFISGHTLERLDGGRGVVLFLPFFPLSGVVFECSLTIIYPAASLKSPQLASKVFLGDQSWNGGSV